MICPYCERPFLNPAWRYCPFDGTKLMTSREYREMCEQADADTKADEAKVLEGREGEDAL